jgi:hypothetical protein
MIVWFPVIAILAAMPCISDAITGTRLNDLVSEVDVTKYQQCGLAVIRGGVLVRGWKLELLFTLHLSSTTMT